MTRVLFHYEAGPALLRRFEALRDAGLEIDVCPEPDEARLRALLPETEVLWHCLRPVDRALMEAAPRLKLVQKIGVGVNTIALDAARERGIAVCNMPGTNARAVAEQTLALILVALRRIVSFDRLVRAGRGWSRDPALQDGLRELCGRTVGLVGYGGVPEALAPMLRALDAEVIHHTRTRRAGAESAWRDLDTLLAEADVVSLHVPLTPETEGMIDDGRLARMKPGSVLVNTARGGLVDTCALLRALTQGPLGAAALDVLPEEPIDPDHPLLKLDNVTVAPHVGWLTQETLAHSLEVAVENCRRLAHGEPLLHRVV